MLQRNDKRTKRAVLRRRPRVIESSEACASSESGAPNFCKYFFGAIGEYQGFAREKIWIRVFGISIFKLIELRHGEAPRRRSHPPS
jgi:hypothetical protein